MQERCKQEEEKLEQEKEIRRSIQEKERREIDKTMIERYRRNQNEIRGQNKFLLEKELRKKVSYFCYFSLSFENSLFETVNIMIYIIIPDDKKTRKVVQRSYSSKP